MTFRITPIIALLALLANAAFCQDTMPVEKEKDKMQTLFRGGKLTTGGYGALTNKFTTINGEFANLAGVYGGVYINHSLMIGAGAVALTNDIRVPFEHSMDPAKNLSYMYGQVGAISEYVIASNKTFHVAFHMFAGAGFTLQYERFDWDDHDEFDWDEDSTHDKNWFTVAEPGVMMEINVFRWMRFSPGISYRAAFGSDARGLSDSDLSNISYNATLKFGRF